MNANTCQIGAKLRLTYLDGGELKAKTAYMTHIQKCPACRGYIQGLFQQSKAANNPNVTIAEIENA